MFYVTLKMAEDRDDGLTRMFFKAFRENFKPATKLWLILLAVGSFLAADGFVLRRMWSENIFWTLLTAVLIGAAVLYGIVLLYTFPLLARFENTTFGILKTAFLVGVRYLFCTLLMAAIYGIMGYVVVFVFTPAFLLGMGFCAMLCSFLMLRILYLIGGDLMQYTRNTTMTKTDRDTLRSSMGAKSGSTSGILQAAHCDRAHHRLYPRVCSLPPCDEKRGCALPWSGKYHCRV